MSINNFFSVIWRQKVIFAAVMLLINIIALSVWKFSPRIYEAETLLLVDRSRTPKPEENSESSSSALSQDRYLKSMVKIAQGEPVIIDVLNHLKNKNSEDPAEIVQLNKRSETFGKPVSTIVQVADENQPFTVLSLQAALKVDVELNTDLLKIAFRDRDPARAAMVANQVASSLIERNMKLYSNPLSIRFFQGEKDKYKDNLSSSSTALEKFSVANQIYAVENQRKLLMSRRDRAQADLSSTQVSISRIQGELESLRVQLSSLKGKMNLPAEIYGDASSATRSAKQPSASSGFGDDPPLLHVKLYQESAQKIINDNAELAGLKQSEVNQKNELQEVDQQLKKLATKSAEFSRLEREVEQNEANFALYSRKSSEAEIQNAWRTNENLSTLQPVQIASVPVRPVFPRGSVVVPLGVLIGLLAGCAAAVLRDAVGHKVGRLHEST
ncbi:Wzz/FepE/Etk N-terminal domain-containing protein [Methylobacterium sp. E-041]|uniref:GumC family protein n=1 Tax=Methylobacterium sp. E-041 TaxID=2836573 RepID=UPI001FBA72BB|nr:Wzz/FepE/Etk N-terminal domain-containing protein [Methylobacterium sp. E-041]MCJ2104445.1 Wzz/FepE/Etk N-terminal domain-containing protein [Methylobacterium sp. E-041]